MQPKNRKRSSVSVAANITKKIQLDTLRKTHHHERNIFSKKKKKKLLNLTTELLEVQDTDEHAEYTTDTPSATQKL